MKCLCHIFVFGQNNSAGGDLGLREKKISNHCRDRDFIVIVNQSQTKKQKTKQKRVLWPKLLKYLYFLSLEAVNAALKYRSLLKNPKHI